jgi:hypothetical protein
MIPPPPPPPVWYAGGTAKKQAVFLDSRLLDPDCELELDTYVQVCQRLKPELVNEEYLSLLNKVVEEDDGQGQHATQLKNELK